ncbi:MAG TPA: hypothetical protein VGE67_09080 [Haloferula sp.]
MAARIGEIPEFAGKVLNFDAGNIESEFEKKMLKAGGGRCAIIRFLGARNIRDRNHKSSYEASFSVSLVESPLLVANEPKSRTKLAGEIEAKLNGWWPDGIPFQSAGKLLVTSISPSLGSDDAGNAYAGVVLTVATPPLCFLYPRPTDPPEEP